VPERLRTVGDPAADIDEHAGRLDALHALADRDETGGLGDAPWPPHFAKQRGEPKRVQPSRNRDRPNATQRGRAGDPQPGGPPEPQHRRPHEPGKRRPPRTGQGFEEEFED
jgi:bifunctional non-homologous end joining protein LigD